MEKCNFNPTGIVAMCAGRKDCDVAKLETEAFYRPVNFHFISSHWHAVLSMDLTGRTCSRGFCTELALVEGARKEDVFPACQKCLTGGACGSLCVSSLIFCNRSNAAH